MTTRPTRQQRRVCRRQGVEAWPVDESLKVGVALNVRSGAIPLNGLRHPPQEGTSGWYFWAGEELSSDPGFFVPIHTEHLGEWRPELLPYLALPPGWRFLITPEYEDVWYDKSLLDV